MEAYVVDLLVEELLQTHNIGMVQSLGDLELSVLIFLILQNVFDGEWSVVGVQHLNQRSRTRYTFPNVPLPICFKMVYSFSFSVVPFSYYLYIICLYFIGQHSIQPHFTHPPCSWYLATKQRWLMLWNVIYSNGLMITTVTSCVRMCCGIKFMVWISSRGC